LTVDGENRHLTAFGGGAHIFSHGSAPHWAWLHADLGDSDLLEVVAAVPHLPFGLHVPHRPIARLRLDGRDHPGESVVAGLVGHCTVEPPEWRAVIPLARGRRVRVSVELPPERSVQLVYPNPDGTFAFCTNTEQANARIVVERRQGRSWGVDREWDLDGTAHSEIGDDQPFDMVPLVPFAHDAEREEGDRP